MQPLIKWPGGKSGEIHQIESLIPPFKRYVEPFFGGGALFFHLAPRNAAINDVSTSLMEYYTLLKSQDPQLQSLLLDYNNSFENLIQVCHKRYPAIQRLFRRTLEREWSKKELRPAVSRLITSLRESIIQGFQPEMGLVLNYKDLFTHIHGTVVDKILRTTINNTKYPFSEEDLKNNLITGFTSGYYMYFRKIFNDMHLQRITPPSLAYKVANFYFIREYCYGSMFRYNHTGEFNIPYGGISYNKKNFIQKIDNMFSREVETIFHNTSMHCCDFAEFFQKIDLKSEDFMFLDPPYDTDFSDYEGRAFDYTDQERLANCLKKTPAQFIMIIKNTDFIYNLYKDSFYILTFDNQYSYNVRSRNERQVEHLIIANFPVESPQLRLDV